MTGIENNVVGDQVVNGYHKLKMNNSTNLNEDISKTRSINNHKEFVISPIQDNLDQSETLLSQQNGGSKNNQADDGDNENYKVYKWRWYMLMVVALLNCSNALSWICYAPSANRVDNFYGPEITNYLTLVFLISAFAIGIFAMWSVFRFGIRSSILAAAWLNGVGSVIRVLSSIDFMPENARGPVVIIGQVIAAFAYPFIMSLPTKVAASWFPDTQRTIANTIGTMSNALGVLLAMTFSPLLVASKSDVLFLNIFVSVFCVTATVLATVGVRSSDPPSPPSRGAEVESTPFFAGIKQLATTRSYVILFFSLGTGIGMYNSLYGLMQQILCSRGYSNEFAGICCALMIVFGFAGSFASGFTADKTKKFELIIKIAYAMAVLGGICFAICALRSNFSIPIAIFCAIFGFFGLAAYPIGLEIGVEVSSPVAETTSSGFIVLSGQLHGALFLLVMDKLKSKLNGPDREVETCSSNDPDSVAEPFDMTIPLIVFCSVGAVIVSVFIIAFRPVMKRMNMENEKQSNGKSKQKQTKPKKQIKETEMIDLKIQKSHLNDSNVA